MLVTKPAVRESVGLGEISGFAKYRVTGRGAAEWLDHKLACKIPSVGRMVLAPMLKHDGKIIGDFSLARLADDVFLIIGSGIAEFYHMRWFLSHASDVKDLRIDSLGLNLVRLRLPGQNLERFCNLALTPSGTKTCGAQKMEMALPAIVGRVSYTGDLGYVTWVAPEYLNRLFNI